MERVSVESIDYQDRSFCISYPILHDPLVTSIKQFGILSPLILLGPAPFRIVTGFRRLEGARHLGIGEVPCFVEVMTEREALLLAIHDNLPRPLNVVEKALCVEKISHTGLDKAESEAILKAMGLQSHVKMINLFLALAQSEETTKAFVARHNPAAHELGLLFSFPLETRSRLVALLTPIHLTSSLLREIIELARLLFIKKGDIPFAHVEGLTKGDDVKAVLKREAYPLLAHMEERLKATKEAMHLPPRIAIATDPYFERSSIDIRITAQNQEEMQDSINKLQSITDNGQIRSIFDLISGDPTRS
jgi:hypothetical protein